MNRIDESAPVIDAWQHFLGQIQACEARLLAAAPDAATTSEAIGYLGRLTSAILQGALNPADRTSGGLYYSSMRIGGWNPEYRMGVARIEPQGRYRLSGRFNDAARIAVGLYTPQPSFGLDLDDYHAVRARLDESFNIMIGGEQAMIQPALSSTLLMMRELQLKPEGKPAEIMLERLDLPMPPPSGAPPSPQALSATIAGAAAELDAVIGQFIRWVDFITQQRNIIEPMPAALDETVRGDAETRYYTGHFDLAPGESLQIEVPETDAFYWMIQATNYWLEPIPSANLNMTTIDPSSRTIILSASDPMRPNWLNTAGRQRGHILCREVGASIGHVPTSRLIKSAD
jgi:hypothetical protein